jgi:hypothetical protein
MTSVEALFPNILAVRVKALYVSFAVGYHIQPTIWDAI